MDYIYTVYLGLFLLIIGTFGGIFGPKVENPVIRLLNIEVAAFGVMLIFLSYDETIALMTYIGVTAALTLVLVRTIIKLEGKYDR
ncbi:EhaE family protein [Methanocaldococcus indicus]|uniref:EhaE family protein n=1 Tax=Methanocaldococcus indicus TaxID=213231 RepID=UPI003C6D2273